MVATIQYVQHVVEDRYISNSFEPIKVKSQLKCRRRKNRKF